MHTRCLRCKNRSLACRIRVSGEHIRGQSIRRSMVEHRVNNCFDGTGRFAV